MEDFVVDTEGSCFLCTDTPSLQNFSPDKPQSGLTTHSLQYLSLYLKMNKRKVFDEEGHVPPDLLAKVERSRLTATLCDECSILNGQFSKLYRRLEMTELKITSCLDLIHLKLLKAEGKSGDSFKYDQVATGQNGKERIVRVLRSEAVHKCFQKFKGVKPKIKVRKLRTEEVTKKILKLKQYLDGERLPENKTDNYVDKAEPHSSKSISATNDDDDDHDYYEDSTNFNDLDRDEEAESDQSMGLMESYRSGGKDEKVLATAFTPELTEDRMSFKGKFIKSVTGKYACKDCSREFSTLRAFYFHYRTEHLKIRYKCSLCESTFTQKGHYDRHQRTVHMGVRFKCAVCEKSFTSKQYLKRHPCGV